MPLPSSTDHAPRRRLIRLMAILLSLSAPGAGALAPGAAAAASPGRAPGPGWSTGHAASAYGTYAFVDDQATSGPTAVTGLGCGARPPAHRETEAGSVSAQPAVSSGAIRTTADVTADRGVATSVGTSTVHGLNLLDGAVVAARVTASSTATYDGSGLEIAAQGSSFAGLEILGLPVTVAPGPNTRIDLPGLGHVILNEQVALESGRQARLTVNMIHVHVTTANPLGVATGTEVIVAHAAGGISLRGGPLGGFAYGTTVAGGETLESDRTAPVFLGCAGTGGGLRSNSVAEVRMAPALSGGPVLTTARGVVTAAAARGQTSARVEAVNLLQGLVTADMVRAQAGARTSASGAAFGSEGSAFANLRVEGHPELTGEVPANTRVDLEGVGRLWLRREIRRSTSIEVRMIEVEVLDGENLLGLPVGTRIRVAVAHASAG